MAEYLEDILGDLLYKEPVDERKTELPSPEELSYKILVKSKKIDSITNQGITVLDAAWLFIEMYTKLGGSIIQQYLYTFDLAINQIQTNEVLSDEEEVGAKQTPKVW